MAKKSALPSVDSTLGPVAKKLLSAAKATEAEKAAPKSEKSAGSSGYVSRRIDVKLTQNQGRKLRDRLRELQDEGAKLANGKHVTSKANVIHWMLENLPAA